MQNQTNEMVDLNRIILMLRELNKIAERRQNQEEFYEDGKKYKTNNLD